MDKLQLCNRYETVLKIIKLRQVQQDYIQMHSDFFPCHWNWQNKYFAGSLSSYKSSSSLEWRIYLLKIPFSFHSALKFIQRAHILSLILLYFDSSESSYIILRSDFWNMKTIKYGTMKMIYFLSQMLAKLGNWSQS